MKRITFSFLCASIILFLQSRCMLNAIAAPTEDGSTLKDPVAMVFIPGSTFLMGSKDGYLDEQPQHEVSIAAFYIDIHEVTNRQYQKFFEETGHTKPAFWTPEFDRPNDPVVGVSWNDAVAYASWAGKRLPTEAEWECAARGGNAVGQYPWGDKPDTGFANFNSFGIAPVKSFKPNGYGIYDMIGNVWEWCSDWYDENYYSVSVRENPSGPLKGKYKVLRGGAWYCTENIVKVTKRYNSNPTSKSYSFGFRCVRSVQ